MMPYKNATNVLAQKNIKMELKKINEKMKRTNRLNIIYIIL